MAMKMESYSTTDLYLASYLKACGLRLQEMPREGRRVTFVFEDRADRSQLVRAYYNDGEVRISSFVHAIQDLKAAVFNF